MSNQKPHLEFPKRVTTMNMVLVHAEKLINESRSPSGLRQFLRLTRRTRRLANWNNSAHIDALNEN